MPPSPESQKKKVFRLLWFGVLLIGLAARFTLLGSGLEYDEIWTLNNFAPLPLSQIFTDLALPNNHPLNTLGVKLCASLFDSPWTIRLSALLAGIGSLLLMPLIAFLWSRRRIAAWIATLIFALCRPVFLYAQQARGYSIQLFFLMLFAAGFLLAGKFRPKRHRFLPETMVFLGGAGAILTLPTSILYLGVITLIGYFFCRKLPFSRLPLRKVLIVGMVLSALWYAINYQALQAARVWGVPVTGIRQFLELISDSMLQLNGPAVLLLAFIGILLCFRRAWPLLFFYLAAFGSALATNAGGARVYLPLTVPTAILAGMGAEAISRRMRTRLHSPSWFSPALLLLFTLLLFWNWNQNAKSWPVRDWHLLHDEILRFAQQELFALDAGDGYPYRWNNRAASEDYHRRLLDTSPERTLISFLRPGELNGIDVTGGSRPLRLSQNYAATTEKLQSGFSICRYRLLEVFNTPPTKSDLLIVIRPLPNELRHYYIQEIYQAYPGLLFLNSWLTLPFSFGKQSRQAATLILHCEDPAHFDWKSFRNRIPGAVSIYRILPEEKEKSAK